MADPLVLCSDESEPIFVWQEDVKLHIICKSGTNGSIPHVNRCPVHVASCVASVIMSQFSNITSEAALVFYNAHCLHVYMR